MSLATLLMVWYMFSAQSGHKGLTAMVFERMDLLALNIFLLRWLLVQLHVDKHAEEIKQLLP